MKDRRIICPVLFKYIEKNHFMQGKIEFKDEILQFVLNTSISPSQRGNCAYTIKGNSFENKEAGMC